MACAMGIVRFIMFGFNLICALAGLAMLVVGIIFQLNITEFTDSIPDNYSAISYIPILLIVVGSIVFVIAFFGCCGAVKESTCMLTTYAVILIIILVIQIALGTLAFLQIKDNSDLKEEMGKAFTRLMQNYQKSPEPVSAIQQALKCCGTTGPDSWTALGMPIPDSCCPGEKGVCDISQRYTQGCQAAMFDVAQNSIKVIGIILISIAAVELVGAIFALCLSSSIKNGHRRGAYA